MGVGKADGQFPQVVSWVLAAQARKKRGYRNEAREAGKVAARFASVNQRQASKPLLGLLPTLRQSPSITLTSLGRQQMPEAFPTPGLIRPASLLPTPLNNG